MKFQAAAMSRQDIPEDERKDFCLFVDEFQNFATESFESILSEARKYRLNLVLANQFMTQLTDKIREALLGNVGTIMSGRLGVTDAELMEKAFSPVFTAEDLHKQSNFCAIATVMMFDMPTAPFTISLLPPMGESSDELMERMKAYALSKYGRPRAEVEAEIDARLAATDEPAPKMESTPAEPGEASKPLSPKKNFLDSWLEKKASLEKQAKEEAKETIAAKQAAPRAKAKAKAAPSPSVAEASNAEAPKVAQVAAATDMRAKVATAPERMPEAPQKTQLMRELEDDGDGSSWVATAVKNAEEAAPAEVAVQVIQKDDLANGVKIHHERRAPASAPAPATVQQAAPAPTPAAPAAPAQPQITAQQGNPEDGVVLRWR